MSADPTWPYDDVELREPIASDPSWACAAGHCSCHPDRETRAAPERFSILLCDEVAARMPGARCRVLDRGILLNEAPSHADGFGWIVVEARRLPEQVLVEWAPADTPLDPRYPYRRLYWVDLARHRREEAAARRLHNLGYSSEPTLEGNIRELQRVYGAPQTGSLDDAEADIIAFHDAGLLPPRPLDAPSGGEPPIVAAAFFEGAATPAPLFAGAAAPPPLCGNAAAPAPPGAGAPGPRPGTLAIPPGGGWGHDPPPPSMYPVLVGDGDDGWTWAPNHHDGPDIVLTGLGPSDRPMPVPKTERQPYLWICHLTMDLELANRPIGALKLGTGPEARAAGTGFLITPRHVLTAGHNLRSVRKSDDQILEARKVTVIPGRNGNATPFGVVEVTSAKALRVSSKWMLSGAKDTRFDYGLITLPEPLDIGSWGQDEFVLRAHAKVDVGTVTRTAGYPGDGSAPVLPVPGQTGPTGSFPVFDDNRVIAGKADQPQKFFWASDPAAGQSGSPVWRFETGVTEQALLGILVTGGQNGGGAVLITEKVAAELRGWIRQDRVAPPPFKPDKPPKKAAR